MGLALFFVNREPPFVQSVEYGFDMSAVFLEILRVDKDIIEVAYGKLVQERGVWYDRPWLER
mgnify:CR=1 FL=1